MILWISVAEGYLRPFICAYVVDLPTPAAAWEWTLERHPTDDPAGSVMIWELHDPPLEKVTPHLFKRLSHDDVLRLFGPTPVIHADGSESVAVPAASMDLETARRVAEKLG